MFGCTLKPSQVLDTYCITQNFFVLWKEFIILSVMHKFIYRGAEQHNSRVLFKSSGNISFIYFEKINAPDKSRN